MKSGFLIVLSLLMLAGGVPARAGVYSASASGSASPNAIIPDGGSALNTLSSSLNISILANQITSISVSLNISGGFNGDLYGYLRGPDGTIAVLVNRVGVTSSDPFGYGDTGLHVTINDSTGTRDIHNYQAGAYTLNDGGQLTGTWVSDGRNTDPNS